MDELDISATKSIDQSQEYIRPELQLNRGYIVNPNAHSKGKWNSNFKLFEWQKQLRSLIHDNEDIIVTAVTSTGKTFISVMLATFYALASGEDKVLILTPSNATLEETFYNIKIWHKNESGSPVVDAMYVIEEEDEEGRSFTTLGHTWHKGTAMSKNPKPSTTPKTQIIVATYEAIIGDGPSQELIKWCKTSHAGTGDFNFTVIIDEAHIPLAYKAVKALVTKKIPVTNYIILSATLSPTDMARYGKLSDNFKVVDSKIRPVPLQLYATYQTSEAGAKRQQRGTVKYNRFVTGNPRLAIGELYSGDDLTASDYARLGLSLPQGREAQYSKVANIYKQKRERIATSNEMVLQRAITKLSEPVNLYGLMQSLMASKPRKIPALLIHKNFTDMRATVIALTEFITDLVASDANYITLSGNMKRMSKGKTNNKQAQEEERMGMTPDATAETIQHRYLPNSYKMPMPSSRVPLKGWIREAAAVHIYLYSEHKEVPAWYRDRVLTAYRDRSIHFLFTDKSLATGVNLPAASVVVLDRKKPKAVASSASAQKADESAQQLEDESDSFYKQAVGRAGRYGMEEAGYANMNLMQVPQEPVYPTAIKKRSKTPSRGITVTNYIPEEDEEDND